MGAEEGELLALGLAGADGEAAGGEAEDLVAGDGLEVAGAGEDHERRQRVRRVQRRQAAEPGEVDRRAGFGRRHRAVGVERRVEGDASGDPGLDHGDLHRNAVDEAGVDQVDGEAGRRVDEQPALVAVLDRGEILRAEVLQCFRQRIGRRERFGGERARLLEHHGAAEVPSPPSWARAAPPPRAVSARMAVVARNRRRSIMCAASPGCPADPGERAGSFARYGQVVPRFAARRPSRPAADSDAALQRPAVGRPPPMRWSAPSMRHPGPGSTAAGRNPRRCTNGPCRRQVD